MDAKSAKRQSKPRKEQPPLTLRTHGHLTREQKQAAWDLFLNLYGPAVIAQLRDEMMKEV